MASSDSTIAATTATKPMSWADLPDDTNPYVEPLPEIPKDDATPVLPAPQTVDVSITDAHGTITLQSMTVHQIAVPVPAPAVAAATSAPAPAVPVATPAPAVPAATPVEAKTPPVPVANKTYPVPVSAKTPAHRSRATTPKKLRKPLEVDTSPLAHLTNSMVIGEAMRRVGGVLTTGIVLSTAESEKLLFTLCDISGILRELEDNN